MHIDGIAFALWRLELQNGFAAVVDYGPLVLAAFGADPSRLTWQLTVAPPDLVRAVLATMPARLTLRE